MSVPKQKLTAAEIQAWLVSRVASITNISPPEIPLQVPFTALGIDSVTLVALSADLGDLIGREVDATLAYEHPTILALSHALAGWKDPGGQTRSAPSSAGQSHSPIAIVGMACRFPSSNSLTSFWEMLASGRPARSTAPTERWGARSVSLPPAALMDDIAGFDADFFRVSATEALRMDPQQRILLELTWEALEDAGLAPEQLRGSDTGVFLGISESEYMARQLRTESLIDGYTATGGARSVAAGRLAYCFDFTGPALSIDTACSSSLVAVHLAIQALRRRECGRAVVAGVNLLLDPEVTLALHQAKMLSPDGRCKTFDAHADGYGRGEGCGVIVLAPHEETVRRKDRSYALLIGSAINSDGATNGLTAPGPESQRNVLLAAYRDACIDPHTVDYVECHGTGTALGDPIEVGSLSSVVGPNRPTGKRWQIGSVKTNIGHLEAAAGIAGLIKTALSLHHATLPASLNVDTPNPRLPLGDTAPVLATQTSPWPGPHVAGVSSFGFSGTNAHVVLHSAGSPPSHDEAQTKPWSVLPLAARSASSLNRLVAATADHLAQTDAPVGEHVAAAAQLRTHHLPFRKAIVAGNHDAQQLAHHIQSLPEVVGDRCGTVSARTGSPRFLFVFSGQGCQWPGMARELISRDPLFRSTIRRCAEAAGSAWSVFDALSGELEVDLDDTAVAQPLIVAVQLGLCTLVRSWGIQPAGVIGHSVGEISAAYAAGALSLEQAMQLACLRGRVMAESRNGGGMLAVDMSADRVRDFLSGQAQDRDRVELAAVNAPQMCVLAGPREQLESLYPLLTAEGFVPNWVPVRYAFHSAAMETVAGHLRRCWTSQPADVESSAVFASTVTGGVLPLAQLTADHWAAGVRKPVLFADGLGALLDGPDPYEAVIEIGGRPSLRSALRAQAHRGPEVLHTLDDRTDDITRLSSVIAECYERGASIRWDRITGKPNRAIRLPSYPWSHDHFLLGRTGPAFGPEPACWPGNRMPLADMSDAVWQTQLDLGRYPLFGEHRVDSRAILPAAAYLEAGLNAADQIGVERPQLVEVVLHDPLEVPGDDAPLLLQTKLSADPSAEGAWEFRMHSRPLADDDAAWQLHASGRLDSAPARPKPAVDGGPANQARDAVEGVDPELAFSQLRKWGLDHGPAFRNLGLVARSAEGTSAPVSVASDAELSITRSIDAAITLIALAVPDHHSIVGPIVPAGVDHLVTASRQAQPVTAEVRVRDDGKPDGDGPILADVSLLDADSHVVIALHGLRLVDVGRLRPATASQSGRGPHEAIFRYQVQWVPAHEETQPQVAGQRWLILTDHDPDGVGNRLSSRIEAAGGTSVLLSPGASNDARGIVKAELSRPTAGVIDLTALAGDSADESLLAPTYRVAALIRELTYGTTGSTPMLLAATRGAQHLPGRDSGPSTAPESYRGSGNWGLLKTSPVENPTLPVRCLDLDPQASTEESVQAVWSELVRVAPEVGDPRVVSSFETEVAYAKGRRYVRRLRAQQLPSHDASTSLVEQIDEGWCVVSGATGALGPIVVRHLLNQGVRRVAMLSRHGGTRGLTEQAHNVGAALQGFAVDVADGDGLRQVLDQLRRSAPIRAVVHAAGVLQDGSILELEQQHLGEALRAKGLGAVNLDKLTRDDPVAVWVAFSSAAAVLGSPGQAAYSAANSIADAVVAGRRSQGLPGVSIAWGPWSPDAGGMAAGAAGAAAVSALSPGEALDVFDRLVSSGSEHEVVVSFNVRELMQFFPSTLGMAFFGDVLSEDDRSLKSIAVQSGTRPAISMEYVPPRSPIELRIAAIWQKSLGIEPIGTRDNFFELGGDSVIGNQILVQVNKAFNVTLDPAAAFATFTVANLADLTETLLVAEVEKLTDAEAAQLLTHSNDSDERNHS